MESDIVDLWHGIGQPGADQLADPRTPTDYDRACDISGYAAVIAMPHERSALVLGDMPMDTGVWMDRDGRSVLVRVMYADSDEHIVAALTDLSDATFDLPDEAVGITFKTPSIVIFDSACPGIRCEESIELEVDTGLCRFVTKYIEPAPGLALVLHRFDPLRH